MNATLRRFAELNGATMGILTIDGLDSPIFTLEHAWLNNDAETSCIPSGVYKCIPHGWEPGNPSHFSKTMVWEITGVKGRTGVLLHVGNTLKDTIGCVLCGLGMQFDQKLSQVTLSAAAIESMRSLIGEQGFNLTIIATPGVAE